MAAKNGKTGPKKTPADRLREFLEHLGGKNLKLYTSPDGDQPSVQIPDDKLQVYYPLTHDRVQTWLWGEYLVKIGEAPPSAHIKAATMYLKDKAYSNGVELPEDEDRFNDDPTVAAINSWVMKEKGSKERAPASRVYEALKAYAEYHPNAKRFPVDVAVLGRRLALLDREGILGKIKIRFTVDHTETGKVYTLERTDSADGLTAPEFVSSGDKSMQLRDLRSDDKPKDLDLTNQGEVKEEIKAMETQHVEKVPQDQPVKEQS